jgi:flavodoxin/ferredoxin
MPKALIAYFSQGGTTEAIAKKISDGLQDEKFQVDLHNIAESEPPDISGYDMIGIGSPVYIYRPPFNVSDYLNSLPELNDLPFFVFMLHGTLTGTAGSIIRKRLTRKGGKEIGYAKFKGADYFVGYLQRGYLFSPDNPSKEELKKAESFGHEIVSSISGAEYVKPAMDSLPPIVYTMERMITTKSQVRYILSRFFKADKKKCTSCGKCIKYCFKKNISFDQNDLPQWGRDCILCFYCEMKCPEDAITSPVDWLIMAPFMNYNVRMGLKNRSIDKVKVVHSKGKTVRIENNF